MLIAESRRILGSVQRTTSTAVRICAVAKSRATIDSFMMQIKLSFPAVSLRDAATPGVPSDPVVVVSDDPSHINCAILGYFESKFSNFRARDKDLSPNDEGTAPDSQSEASRGLGGGHETDEPGRTPSPAGVTSGNLLIKCKT